MAAFAAGRAFAAPSGMFAGGGARLVFAAMSDIHVCHPKTGRMLGTEVFERALDSLPQGPLVFKVCPGDCFGKLGRPISARFDA